MVTAAPSLFAELERLRADYERERSARLELEERVRGVAELEDALARHLRQVEGLQRQLGGLCSAVVSTIAALLDARDHSMSDHANQVMSCAVSIARELGLGGDELEAVRLAALLHDVGKVGVPDELLRKPGPLSADEWQAMRRHPELGGRLLNGLPLPRATVDAILYHHERYDGRGYPTGLAGENIPLGARIVAVADAFDAMTSDRPYRRRLSLDVARREIADCARTHFCPDVVEAFLAVSARGELRAA